MIRILFGGDICPRGGIHKAFEEGNADKIFNDLLEDIKGSDLSIVNLECPLISQETPIAKGSGPVLGASRGCIQGFAAAPWSVLNLANNHSFDHGENGLSETLDTIRGAGLDFLGAGLDIEDAKKPLIKMVEDQRIVIYSMAEREYSVADSNTAGANPLDLINFVNAVRQYKQEGVFIALIHGGSEHYPYPSPEMARRCRFMIDMGADAVICCHAHCPLPWEIYKGSPIAYGLGNLIFETRENKADGWYEGYLGELTIKEKQIHFEAIPYSQSRYTSGAQKMIKKDRNQFFEEMGKKCAQVKDNVFLENQWTQYCINQRDLYLAYLFGYRMRMRNWRRWVLPLLHSKEAVADALNLVQCEAHQEILNTIFKYERKNG